MNDYEIWFAISQLSYTTKNILLNNFKTLDKIWYYSIRDKKNEFINEKIRSILKKSWDKAKINNLKTKLLSENINTVVITDSMYPERLKKYEDSPYMLFYKGNIEKLNTQSSAGIVGSRKCTNYGINVTNIVCESLCENNVNIISGMARGIDSIAHKKCISKNSYTCAVLGSGIDVVYPRENLKIYNSIINNGCIISQFLPGTQPYSYNFPIRNRIISALSDVLIVVEAGEKSGSLITAGAALDQGKDVIVVPGNIFSPESRGANQLIKEGAYILTNIEDVFQLLHIENTKQMPQINVKMKTLEKVVYDNINNSPIHFDDILRLTKIDIKQLYEVLFELQLKEEVMYISGNYYVRNNKRI